jgi:glucose/arabinose dehydrogenase
MIAWKSTLSIKQIQALADYILKAKKSPNAIKTATKPLTVHTKLYTLRIEKLITEGLEEPWGLEFVDSNRALITGRKGKLYLVVNRKLDKEKIIGVPKTYAYNLVGGMMDIAVDPQYAKNGWIYIALSDNPAHSTDSTVAGMTKVVRGKLRGHQ